MKFLKITWQRITKIYGLLNKFTQFIVTIIMIIFIIKVIPLYIKATKAGFFKQVGSKEILDTFILKKNPLEIYNNMNDFLIITEIKKCSFKERYLLKTLFQYKFNSSYYNYQNFFVLHGKSEQIDFWKSVYKENGMWVDDDFLLTYGTNPEDSLLKKGLIQKKGSSFLSQVFELKEEVRKLLEQNLFLLDDIKTVEKTNW